MTFSEATGAVLTLVDGVPHQESVSILDRGLHFGDGLFETIACRDGRPRFLSYHLERLTLGCQRLGFAGVSTDAIREEVTRVAQETGHCIVKTLVTRGTAVARGYGVSGREKATRITLCYDWPHEEPSQHQDGVRVRTASLRLGENPALAGLKHCNRLEQILARQELWDPAIVEALLYSSRGHLVSGTMSNVFLVRGRRLLTPLIDVCGVAGVMRRVVLTEARRAGLDTEEMRLGAADFERVDEVFLTNARIGLWPVRELDGRGLAAGPVTRQMQALVEQAAAHA